MIGCGLAIGLAVLGSPPNALPAGPYGIRYARLPSELLHRTEGAESRESPILDVWYPDESAVKADSKLPSVYPLILYFPGWPGDSINNRILVAELVSRGYAVATFTYPARLPSMTDADYRRQLDNIHIPMDFSSLPALEHTTDLFEQRVRSRGADAGLVVELLQRLQNSTTGPEIAHRLDLSRIGVLGFSLGGAIANHICSTDRRIRSAVDLDATHWVDPPNGSEFCRLLYITEAPVRPVASSALKSPDALTRGGAEMDQRDYARIVATFTRFGATEMVVPHTTHMDFSDEVVKSPIRRRLRGLIGSRRLISILNDAVVSFFDATLSSGRSPFERSPRFEALKARYGDIHVTEWAPAPTTSN